MLDENGHGLAKVRSEHSISIDHGSLFDALREAERRGDLAETAVRSLAIESASDHADSGFGFPGGEQ